jgi:hypothetical protein
MLYSATDLRRDTEYLCSFGIDRGIPCLYDKERNFGGGGSWDGGLNLPNLWNPGQGQEYGPYGGSGGGTGYGRLTNGFGEGRFLSTDWLAWLKSSKAHFAEKCFELLPRILHCNRYYELKITAGVRFCNNNRMCLSDTMHSYTCPVFIKSYFDPSTYKIFLHFANFQVMGLLNGILYAVTGIMVLAAN